MESISRELLLGVGGTVMVLALLWRYRRQKALVMGTAGFLFGLFPVLHIVPTSAVSLVSMRWLYFPMAFFTLAWCRPIAVLLRKPARVWILVGLLVGLGSYSAYLNRFQWHSDAVLFQREVMKFGNMAYAGGMADILHNRGQYREAEFYYLRGISARPDMVETHIGYAALLIDTGRPDRALAVLEKIAARNMSRENRGRMENNRGMALMRLGKTDEALAILEQSVVLAPGEPTFWGNLGSAYGIAGDYGRSVQALEKGLALSPESVGLLSNLVLTRIHMKDFKGAAEAFEQLPEAEQQKRADLEVRINRCQ